MSKNPREAAKARGESGPWTFSDGKYRNHGTRSDYQEETLRFITWARETEGIKMLSVLDERREELASRYLQERLNAHQSPWTLQKVRSALRFFFDDGSLAESVALPKRRREGITRSRKPAARDRHFQPANWQPLLHFERAIGLRKGELSRIQVGDIGPHPENGMLSAHVWRGKGGKERYAEVLPGREQEVLSVVAGRDPGELIFPRIPDTDIHSYRREYAQALYLYYAPGWSLPPTVGRLRPGSYHKEAARKVSRALGHNRVDVVLNHYIR